MDSLDIPTEVFGSRLRQQVEDRLKFYETGDIPAKNVDVMVDALSEVSVWLLEKKKGNNYCKNSLPPYVL